MPQLHPQQPTARVPWAHCHSEPHPGRPWHGLLHPSCPGTAAGRCEAAQRLLLILGCKQGHAGTFAFCKEIRPHPFPAVPQLPWDFPRAGQFSGCQQHCCCLSSLPKPQQSCRLANTLLGKCRGKPGELGKKSESNPAGFGGNLEKEKSTMRNKTSPYASPARTSSLPPIEPGSDQNCGHHGCP